MAYPYSDPAANKTDNTDTPTDHPDHHNELAQDLIDLKTELGSGPKGGSADLTTRLSTLDTTVAGKAATSHSHAESDVTSLVSDLAGKAAASHSHAESDVTNLVSDLASKATPGTPALTLGTANSAGVATTAVRTDATIAAFDVTAPTTSAFGDAAATGAAAVAARRDHKHAMPADPTGKPLGLTGATAATRYVGATASGAPGSGTFAVGDFVIDQTGTFYICTAAGSPGTWVQAGSNAYALLSGATFTGEVIAPDFKATGKTGATNQATILAGGTASGAPTTGTHVAGELIFDATGVGYYCTVGGTPGTWVQVGGSSASYGLSLFADGSDGSQTFDGSTTILGMAPSSSIYTLTRDIFLSGATINNGVVIVTAGYRIFCSGTLTNNGTIRNNGNNASSATGANNALTGQTFGGLTGTGVAKSGGTGSGAAAGTANNCFGGAGGAGGAGSSAGGAGGSAFTPSVGSIRSFLGALIGVGIGSAGTSLVAFLPGQGGASGGGDGTNSGGGGGGGGGAVLVVAKTIAGTGVIQARGGNGANGTAGNTGGGGGGGGGYVVIISGSVSGGAVSGQTVDANGGSKGLKSGTGSDGSNGSNGTTVFLAA